MSSKSCSSSKLLNKRLEDIWSHWSPRHSGKTTQSLLLIMETVAASLGLKITLKISLLLRHYFLGLLPFAAPTWNCYRTITVCSSTSGSNKKTFAVEKKVKCENRLKKNFVCCNQRVATMFQKRQTFLRVEDGGRLQRLSTTVKQPCVGKLRRFNRDRLQRRGGKNLICSAATFWKLYRKRGTNKQKIHQRHLFNISILSNISVLCNFCRAPQTLQRHHLSILFRRHLPKYVFFGLS